MVNQKETFERLELYMQAVRIFINGHPAARMAKLAAEGNALVTCLIEGEPERGQTTTEMRIVL